VSAVPGGRLRRSWAGRYLAPFLGTLAGTDIFRALEAGPGLVRVDVELGAAEIEELASLQGDPQLEGGRGATAPRTREPG
jgi:hypothetical protein